MEKCLKCGNRRMKGTYCPRCDTKYAPGTKESHLRRITAEVAAAVYAVAA